MKTLWVALIPLAAGVLPFAILQARQARTPYVLGPDDQITVQALHAPEIADRPIRIESSGYITLPLAGRVKAAGLTVEQLQTEISARLREFVQRPQVTVGVTEYRSQPVSVMGAVNAPGIYQVQGRKALMEVLSLAGGARPEAADTIRITRRIPCEPLNLPKVRTEAAGGFVVGEVSLLSLLQARSPEENVAVCPDDVITLPRAAVVYIMGEVRKPGGFPLLERDSLSVLELVSKSEGMLRTAASSQARILRVSEPGRQRSEIPVNVKAILSGKAADVSLRADDILVIPGSAYKTAMFRSVEAAVQMGTGIVIWNR
jgi:polysaccharide biosynthesis/export protein